MLKALGTNLDLSEPVFLVGEYGQKNGHTHARNHTHTRTYTHTHTHRERWGDDDGLVFYVPFNSHIETMAE